MRCSTKRIIREKSMEYKKCVVYNFAKGSKENADYYSYKNGQLDLDLNIEVRSPKPEYKSNVLKFKNLKKIKKNDSSKEELKEPFNIA